MAKKRVTSLIERKLQNKEYRARFERNYPTFMLEVQILKALEEKGWSYEDLAKALGTSKSNISRDLAAGGIRSATLKRISRIAEALEMELVPILVSQSNEKRILPKLYSLIA